MSFSLVHPYITYLIYFVIVGSLSAWIGDFIKKKNDTINIILATSNILSIIGLSIINSIFLIFIYSAGFFLDIHFVINIFWIGLYIYCANEILKIFSPIFENIKFYRVIPKLVIVGPFIVSFIIFYLLFYGNKIYKLSPHCKNTNDQKVKVCKYSNGTYTGEMKAFKRHGLGEYVWNTGKTWDGQWENGKRVNENN
ncbi:hypothetical protein N9T36_01070 [bacterium]|nr:hypothetical protein [bacterium]